MPPHPDHGPAATPGRRPSRLLERWYAPFTLIHGGAVGLAPILLPLAAIRQGPGHVGLVMGALNLGAFAAPVAAGLAARMVLLAILAVLAAAGSVPAAVPLAAFGGILFAWSFLSVASPGLTGELVPQAEGEAQGVLNASSGLAGFAGAVIGGQVASHAGYPAALGLGAAATAVGLLIFAVKLLRPRSRPAAAAPAPS